MDWASEHKTSVAITLALIVLVVVAIWFWGVLVEYVSPGTKGATDRKDVVQTFALLVAGVVGLIGALVGIANLQTSRRNLQQQRDLEEQRTQEAALQSYFEQMGDLLTNHNLIETDREDIRQLAQGQTRTVLARLDEGRKGALVRFLQGAGLIKRDEAIISLNSVLLDNVELYYADLRAADLSKTYLHYAHLSQANLRDADLSKAYLVGADLSYADLSRANLSGADLTNAMMSDEHLRQAESFEGATMPTGQKYEDWLKEYEDWLKDREGRKEGGAGE